MKRVAMLPFLHVERCVLESPNQFILADGPVAGLTLRRGKGMSVHAGWMLFSAGGNTRPALKHVTGDVVTNFIAEDWFGFF